MNEPSQVSPLKPEAHSQENLSPLFVQVPLFLQGRLSQGVGINSASVKTKIITLVKKK